MTGVQTCALPISPVALTRTSTKKTALLEAGAADVIATEEQDLAGEVARITGGKGAQLVFDSVGGPNFEKLANATAAGGILIVYGRFSPDITPLPIAQTLWKDLTIRGFGLPATIARDDKLTAVKKFINEGLASGALKPIIAKTFDASRDVPDHGVTTCSDFGLSFHGFTIHSIRGWLPLWPIEPTRWAGCLYRPDQPSKPRGIARGLHAEFASHRAYERQQATIAPRSKWVCLFESTGQLRWGGSCRFER